MAKKSSLSSLNSVLSKFSEKMGEGIIHTAEKIPNCLKIQSRVPAYNYVTCGGFAVGRIIEHVGTNGSLKSYLAYDAIAKFQRFDWANNQPDAFVNFEYEHEGVAKEIVGYKYSKKYKPKKDPVARRVALVDIEATYTPDWGETVFDIDNDGLLLIRPTLLTEVVDIVQALLADESISLVVIDSLSAVGTDDEVEKSMEDQQMASAPRFWNKAVRKFQAAMNSNPTKQSTLLVINSMYSKVGVVYGDPEVVRNGEQLQRSKSVSVLFKGAKIQEGKTDFGEIAIGRNITMKALKCKVGVNGRKANFFYSYVKQDGLAAYQTDVDTQIVDLAMKYGFIIRRGAWYDYGSVHAQGMDKMVAELKKTGLIKELEEKIYSAE